MNPEASRQTREFVDEVARSLSSNASRASLEQLAAELAKIARSLDLSMYRRAGPGEELLYSLAESQNGPSLYLVSDGTGTTSPPHEHLTWAIIVGLSGVELNTFYTASSIQSRVATRLSELRLGTSEVAVMEPSAIHSTKVVGNVPTCHLHLYGKPLHSLPEFQSRVYSIDEPPSQQ